MLVGYILTDFCWFVQFFSTLEVFSSPVVWWDAEQLRLAVGCRDNHIYCFKLSEKRIADGAGYWEHQMLGEILAVLVDLRQSSQFFDREKLASIPIVTDGFKKGSVIFSQTQF